MVNDFLTFPQRLIVRLMQKAISNKQLAKEGKKATEYWEWSEYKQLNTLRQLAERGN
jgi:hypothetical protein